MGRHSAPDDPDDVAQGSAGLALRERAAVDGEADAGARGRHSRSEPVDVRPSPAARSAADHGDLVTLDELIAPDDADTEADTDAAAHHILPVVGEPARPVPRPAPVTPPVATGPPPGHPVLRGAAHNSAADLQLVRSHRGVLGLCIAAVLLPFVVEIVVLVVLGTLDGHSVLVWLWAPLVVAGVLLGVTLDVAHRRHTKAVAPAGTS